MITEPIYIKRNIKSLLVAMFFGVFLIGSLGVMLILNINGNLSYDNNGVRLIIGLVFILLGIFMFLKILNYFSIIKIDKASISIISIFKTRIYPVNEFEKIKISEITEYYSLSTDRTCITMRNGEKLDLYSFKYSNFYELRMFLAILNGENFVSKELNENEAKKENSFKNIKFNDSHIISFTGIVFYTLVVAALIGIYKNENNDFFQLFLFLIFITLMFSRRMNYFILTNEHLIIKNSIKFWKNDSLKLNTIKSIEINEYIKQPGKSIVIKTYDYKVKEYSSDNLWSKTWIDFKRNIGNKNITIIDNGSYPRKPVLY